MPPKTLSMDEFLALKSKESSPKSEPRVLSPDEFSRLKSQETSSYTPVESALLGVLQSATLGFSDEGEGVLRGVADVISSGKMDIPSLLEAYKKRRDAARLRDAQAQEQNPVSYGAGSVAGGIATAFVPGLNMGKAASIAGRIGQAGLMGGVMGLGTSKAENLSDMASDTAKGAALNSVIQGGFEALTPVAKGIVNRLSNMPEDRAVKAVTGQNISALRKMGNTTLQSAGDLPAAEESIRKVGKDLLEEGVIGPLDRVEDIAPRLAAAREKYGQQIGQVGSEIDQLIPKAVDSKSIANELIDYASSIPETEAGKRLQERILNEAANFEKMGGMSFADAQAFKNQFKYKPVDADALISNQDAINKIRGVIGGQMDTTAKTLSESAPDNIKDLLSRYQEIKGKYGSFKKASDAATDRVQKNLSNRFVSPSDYGMGTGAALLTGLASGGTVPAAVATGVAASAANKFARERGSALAAVTASKIRDVLRSEGVQAFKTALAPIIEGVKKGSPSSILTFQILKKSYPELPQILGE